MREMRYIAQYGHYRDYRAICGGPPPFKLDLAEAITLGQTLLRLQLIRHVVDEHDFIDQDYFYHFA